MERSFDAVLLEQCAPTLAGIKPASLFRYQPEETALFRREVHALAKILAPFGVAVRLLKTCSHTGACLVYVYRAGWLRQILMDPANREFLVQSGYTLDRGCGGLLEQLSGRLCLEQDFPHEIGLFLGYPLEDVVGFIQNRGRNYTCCGQWKVYGDPDTARKRFEDYRRCTVRYRCCFLRGDRLAQLVAG